MEGKVTLITGGTSGIGRAAATALAAMGAEVVVTGRSKQRGEAAVGEIRETSGSEQVSLMLADLAVQAEVRGLAEGFRERYERLDVLFTYELAERLEGTGVVANCLHPGAVNTNFGKNNRSLGTLIFRAFKPFMRSPQGGADTIIYLASSPEAGRMTGKYLTDRKVVSSFEEPHDEATQKRLWEVSEELTNLKVAS